MGTYDSMYTALSGMNANSLAISVVGDNLANLNTVGYKASRATFQDVLGQTMIGAMGSRRLGQGVTLKSIDEIHTQGGFQATGNVTDLAIAGNGFFVVRDANAAAEGQFYTRAGQFMLDNQGNVVTPSGMRLQGYVADASGAMGSALGDINLQDAEWPAKATESVTMRLNLPANDKPIDTNEHPFDPNDAGSYNDKTSVTVYDSLGRAQSVDVYFVKGDNNEWSWIAGRKDASDTFVEAGNGILSFDTEGQLADGTGSLFIDPGDGAADGQNIAIDFGFGPTGSSSRAGAFDVRSLSQDGSSGGALEAIRVDDDGTITGTFENGKSRELARVALAMFDSVGGLERKGGNLWARTVDSGEPLIGAAGDGGRGLIVAGHLEASNVDITKEFVELIAAQRGFQASSRTITTVDQLLSETVNLKR